jgi:hypothetical protein
MTTIDIVVSEVKDTSTKMCQRHGCGTCIIYNLQQKLELEDMHMSHPMLWQGMQQLYNIFHVVSKTLNLKSFDPPSKSEKATIE